MTGALSPWHHLYRAERDRPDRVARHEEIRAKIHAVGQRLDAMPALERKRPNVMCDRRPQQRPATAAPERVLQPRRERPVPTCPDCGERLPRGRVRRCVDCKRDANSRCQREWRAARKAEGRPVPSPRPERPCAVPTCGGVTTRTYCRSCGGKQSAITRKTAA
jgi:hypothetical protein